MSVWVKLFPTHIRWKLSRWILGGPEAARRMGAKVGVRSRVLSFGISAEAWLVTIGSDSTISSDVLFITHDGGASLAADEAGRRYFLAPIVVGDRSFIGARVILLPGVHVGNDCIVAAGSVVSRSIPDGVIAAGNPARIVGRTADYVDRAIREWPSENDLHGRDRDEIVEWRARPYLKQSEDV